MILSEDFSGYSCEEGRIDLFQWIFFGAIAVLWIIVLVAAFTYSRWIFVQERAESTRKMREETEIHGSTISTSMRESTHTSPHAT